MILPTKRIPEDRALLYIGAQVLALLDEAKTVSRVWEELQRVRDPRSGYSPITYDWFVLALDALYMMKAISLARGRLGKGAS